MQFTFSQELVDTVKNNWLISDNKQEFNMCETDSDWCITFVRVSNMVGLETGLASKISKIVCEQISRNK